MLNFHPAFIFAKNNSKCLKPLTSLHVLKVSICVKSHQRTRHILFQILQNVWRNQTFSCRTTGNGGLGQTHKVMLVTHQERLMLTGQPVPNLQGRDWHGSCLLVSMPLEFGDSFSISLRGPAPRLCPEILTQLSINVTKGCLALSQRDSPETGNLSSSRGEECGALMTQRSAPAPWTPPAALILSIPTPGSQLAFPTRSPDILLAESMST